MERSSMPEHEWVVAGMVVIWTRGQHIHTSVLLTFTICVPANGGDLAMTAVTLQ